MMMVRADNQARCGRLNDPLLQPERTRIEEERIALQCVTGERLSSAIIEQLCLPAALLATTSTLAKSKPWASTNVCDIESTEHQRKR